MIQCISQYSIGVKGHHDQGNYSEIKHLIGACLLFQRFSPLWQAACWHTVRHRAGEVTESFIFGMPGSRGRESH